MVPGVSRIAFKLIKIKIFKESLKFSFIILI